MREFDDHFREEYVYLADVTHDAALIAWGAFFFSAKMKLIPDKKLHMLDGHEHRRSSIGASSESYGPAVVEVTDGKGKVVAAESADKNYVWVEGLAADTKYTYTVTVGGKPWADQTLCTYNPKTKEVKDTKEPYDNSFSTFPDRTKKADLTFAVIGDTGTGSPVQDAVAGALAAAVEAKQIRLVVMPGDMVYKKSGGSGDDDDEWLVTYFQPYRRIINRIPVYPLMGNHDTNEMLFSPEKQSDRGEIYDNFLVLERFRNRPHRDSSITPGLFYRFQYGDNVEFMMLDTSHESGLFPGKAMYRIKNHAAYLETVFATPLNNGTWRIPFTHHPPYCKGPQQHHDSDDLAERILLGKCVKAGVKAFFSGHEHNFQCFRSADADRTVTTFLSGGGGGFREGEPDSETDGNAVCWGGNKQGHFLIAEIKGNKMTVSPVGADGKPLPLADWHGNAFTSALVVQAD